MKKKATAAKKKKTTKTTAKSKPKTATVDETLALLRRASTKKDIANLSRFGITTDTAYGVSMANLLKIAKSIGTDHALAAALWKSGVYEARMLASLIDDPKDVTAAQMERWCKDFDNWAIVDTACFKLFDRTPHAWAKIEEWAEGSDEMVVRASFALLASVALHEEKKKSADDDNDDDAPFKESLLLVERIATADDRNFVKKAVSWALKAIATRSRPLYDAALSLAERLSIAKTSASARWVGKDALRDLRKPAALQRVSPPRKNLESDVENTGSAPTPRRNRSTNLSNKNK